MEQQQQPDETQKPLSLREMNERLQEFERHSINEKMNRFIESERLLQFLERVNLHLCGELQLKLGLAEEEEEEGGGD